LNEFRRGWFCANRIQFILFGKLRHVEKNGEAFFIAVEKAAAVFFLTIAQQHFDMIPMACAALFRGSGRISMEKFLRTNYLPRSNVERKANEILIFFSSSS